LPWLGSTLVQQQGATNEIFTSNHSLSRLMHKS